MFISTLLVFNGFMALLNLVLLAYFQKWFFLLTLAAHLLVYVILASHEEL